LGKPDTQPKLTVVWLTRLRTQNPLKRFPGIPWRCVMVFSRNRTLHRSTAPLVVACLMLAHATRDLRGCKMPVRCTLPALPPSNCPMLLWAFLFELPWRGVGLSPSRSTPRRVKAPTMRTSLGPDLQAGRPAQRAFLVRWAPTNTRNEGDVTESDPLGDAHLSMGSAAEAATKHKAWFAVSILVPLRERSRL
jgi:hypothetical protein